MSNSHFWSHFRRLRSENCDVRELGIVASSRQVWRTVFFFSSCSSHFRRVRLFLVSMATPQGHRARKIPLLIIKRARLYKRTWLISSGSFPDRRTSGCPLCSSVGCFFGCASAFALPFFVSRLPCSFWNLNPFLFRQYALAIFLPLEALFWNWACLSIRVVVDICVGFSD